MRRILGTRSAAHNAFTLIELLVVIAIIAILTVIVVPTKHEGSRSSAVACVSNTKQLMLGWIMYASDFNDSLMGNRPYTRGGISSNNWVSGVMDWSANPDNTNDSLLISPTAGVMAFYVKSPATYHCPSDESVSVAGPRVRSYSMNGFMDNNTNAPALAGWKRYFKLMDLRAPTETLVLAEEHPNSIDDGCFVNDPTDPKRWIDLPASRHAKSDAACFAFSDGHSEIHRWLEASTKQPMVRNGHKPSVSVGRKEAGADLAWILERMTDPAPK